MQAITRRRPVQPSEIGWLQGGSDALHAVAASEYTANVRRLVWRTRADRATPHIPLVCGPIRPPRRFPASKLVGEVRLRLSVQLTDAAVASTASLPEGEDDIHDTNDALLQSGRDLARAHLMLVTSSPASARRILLESAGEVPASSSAAPYFYRGVESPISRTSPPSGPNNKSATIPRLRRCCSIHTPSSSPSCR